jgi:hypothetical protein
MSEERTTTDPEELVGIQQFRRKSEHTFADIGLRG